MFLLICNTDATDGFKLYRNRKENEVLNKLFCISKIFN